MKDNPRTRKRYASIGVQNIGARHSLYRHNIDIKNTPEKGSIQHCFLSRFLPTFKHLGKIISNYKICVLQPYHDVTSHNKTFSRLLSYLLVLFSVCQFFLILSRITIGPTFAFAILSPRNFFFCDGSTNAPDSLSRIIIDVES